MSAILWRLDSEGPSVTPAGLAVAWLEAGLLVGQAKPGQALVVIDQARAQGHGGADIHRAALALSAARALRALGRYEEAVAEADQAVELYETTGGDRLALIARRERLAAKRGAGDLEAAAAEAEDLVDRLWGAYKGRTVHAVDQILAAGRARARATPPGGHRNRGAAHGRGRLTNRSR